MYSGFSLVFMWMKVDKIIFRNFIANANTSRVIGFILEFFPAIELVSPGAQFINNRYVKKASFSLQL